MGLYDFKPRFVPLIRSGEKNHTIRATRKYVQKPGKPMYLYTGLRRKGARRIAIVECSRVQSIKIDTNYPDAEVTLPWDVTVWIDGVQLSPDECERLARTDGFANFEDMVRFWDGRLPFEGHIIHWKKP